MVSQARLRVALREAAARVAVPSMPRAAGGPAGVRRAWPRRAYPGRVPSGTAAIARMTASCSGVRPYG
jgi:hypothetical protein